MPTRTYTRVAVAQLDCLPAIESLGRAPFEDPLFDLTRPDSFRPQGTPSPILDSQFHDLRKRIAHIHFHQLLLKVKAILSHCQQWEVRLIVFPEYSIPWQILKEVATVGGDLVIVAGTHIVTQPAVNSGLYEQLGGTKPALGEAVCPVLHCGRLLGLQPKLSPAKLEEGLLQPGNTWSPIKLPKGLPGPMGVLICLDFLHREGKTHRKLVSKKLAKSRFLAVPSYTPHHSEPEFAAKAKEEALRYKRPVLWADVAMFSEKTKAGGSSIFVDEGHSGDLLHFPEHPGYLEPGDEGVIISDVDLGLEPVGSSTRYDWKRPITPFAAASLVYSHHPASERYAQWLGKVAPLLNRDDDDAVEALAKWITADKELLLDASSSSKVRENRLHRLVREPSRILSMKQVRLFTRDIVLPPKALPLSALRRVLAEAASEAISNWQKDWNGFGLGALTDKLHEVAHSMATINPNQWTETGQAALEAVRRAVLEKETRQLPPPLSTVIEVQSVPPSKLDPTSPKKSNQVNPTNQLFKNKPSKSTNKPRLKPPPSSPFNPGPHLKNAQTLTGRDDAIRELLKCVERRSPSVIIGPRHAGKTWLLEHLEWRLKLNPNYKVYMETLQGKTLRSANDLAQMLEPEITSGCPINSTPSAWVLRELEKQSNPKTKALHRVYLLDEVACLQHSDETLLPWLRKLGKNYGSIVLTGSKWDWERVVRHAADASSGSNFSNDFKVVPLGPISETDACHFLTTTSSGIISETVANWVIEMCGAWPFYLQVMGDALYLASKDGSHQPFREKDNLAELYDQCLLMGQSQVFENRLSELPERVRTLLLSYHSTEPEFFDLPREDRTLLVGTGLCTISGTWLSDRPFFDWIRKYAAVVKQLGG